MPRGGFFEVLENIDEDKTQAEEEETDENIFTCMSCGYDYESNNGPHARLKTGEPCCDTCKFDEFRADEWAKMSTAQRDKEIARS